MKQFVLLSVRNRFILSRCSSTSFGNEVRGYKETGRLGGQNLTERHTRLAKSLRGKNEFVGGFNVPSTSADPSHGHGRPALKASSANSFRGFVIPEIPQEPSSEGASP
jgi:hypothetical protein